jgi:hypothetical protein
MTVKVRVHIKTEETKNLWSGREDYELTRVPCVGEHISFSLDKSPEYKVTFVNHLAFEEEEFDAEIFVQPTDYSEVHRAVGWEE